MGHQSSYLWREWIHRQSPGGQCPLLPCRRIDFSTLQKHNSGKKLTSPAMIASRFAKGCQRQAQMQEVLEQHGQAQKERCPMPEPKLLRRAHLWWFVRIAWGEVAVSSAHHCCHCFPSVACMRTRCLQTMYSSLWSLRGDAEKRHGGLIADHAAAEHLRRLGRG